MEWKGTLLSNTQGCKSINTDEGLGGKKAVKSTGAHGRGDLPDFRQDRKSYVELDCTNLGDLLGELYLFLSAKTSVQNF